MSYYPFYKELQDASLHMPKGNFGLWYNKLIPLNNENECNPSDDKSDKNRNVDFYCEMYASMKRSNASKDMLKQKHTHMDAYCTSFPDKYAEILICATLMTPLITGIGESHPHEVSMVFDHNMGIPYIPASGVKGIVRFAHTLSIFLDANGTVKEPYKDQEHLDETMEDIPDIFGGEKEITGQEKDKTIMQRGKVFFLDAYPSVVPDLHVDIMNPHYAPYYSEGKPPADHHNPTPIKFLTVAKGTSFIFRAIAEKEKDLSEKVRAALVKALTEEGVGAKTAVGYGRFQIDEQKTKALLADREKRRQEEKDRLFPWRVHLARIQDINDWGQFKQIVLDNAKLAEYRSEKEVAEAVQAKALDIRDKWKKSWEGKRDDEIAAWLSPSGLSWQAHSMKTAVPLEEMPEDYKRIESLRDWGAFKSAGIDAVSLSPDALKLLVKKMEEWECNSKKAKDDKKQAYKQVKDLLKRTKS